jgi:hypothetical protein
VTFSPLGPLSSSLLYVASPPLPLFASCSFSFSLPPSAAIAIIRYVYIVLVCRPSVLAIQAIGRIPSVSDVYCCCCLVLWRFFVAFVMPSQCCVMHPSRHGQKQEPHRTQPYVSRRYHCVWCRVFKSFGCVSNSSNEYLSALGTYVSYNRKQEGPQERHSQA